MHAQRFIFLQEEVLVVRLVQHICSDDSTAHLIMAVWKQSNAHPLSQLHHVAHHIKDGCECSRIWKTNESQFKIYLCTVHAHHQLHNNESGNVCS
jgi:hypothetical protein